MNSCLLAAGSLALDRIMGDPRFVPHPVVGIGRWIMMLDQRLNPLTTGDVAERGTALPRLKRLLGVLLALSTVVLVGGLTWGLVYVATRVSPILGDLLSLWLISATIAWKGLIDAGFGVYRCLVNQGLPEARMAVGRIVGRDTGELTKSEVVRATVETLAENIVDAIVSPLFFACLGGAPLAMAYRAVNTLDSMVGYKDARYIHFGWASARLDDVCNYIPARLTALLLGIAALLTRSDAKRGWRVMRRDAQKHASPNSGIPEAMVAGILGIQLGGLNSYGGVPSVRALMGDKVRSLEPMDILAARRLVTWTAVLAGIIVILVGTLEIAIAQP